MALAGMPVVAQQQPVTLQVPIGEIISFSIVSSESLPAGPFKVTYDFEGQGESLYLASTDDAEFGEMSLQYQAGQLTRGTQRRGEEGVLEVDFTRSPPVARWGEGVGGPLPSPEELQRRIQILAETGAAVRRAFGLAQFRGRPDEVAAIILDGRSQVQVLSRALSHRGSTYTLLDPVTADMIESLDHDDFVERWLVRIIANACAIEKSIEVGLTTRRRVLVWQNGTWSAEEFESRPAYRTGSSRPLSAAEAREVLGEASTLLQTIRQRYRSEQFTVPLERFGFP